MTNVNEILGEPVSLTADCMDRIYLNGYIPTLQVPGQLVNFLTQHCGNVIPSPIWLGKIGQQFQPAIHEDAEQHEIPLVHWEGRERKDELAQAYRSKFKQAEGVVFIGVAQARAQSFTSTKEQRGPAVSFEWSRQGVRVNHYYFYLQDANFGPAFIKICSYVPYAIKVYLNGHEWAKQQLRKEGIAFEALENGFLSCAQPERLQALCDQLSPAHIPAFLDKWIERLPMPLTAEDRQAGYRHRLSVWQLEVSRTQVLDDPVRGREFFEAVIQENLDWGRPDRVQLVFDRKIIGSTPGRFRTRVIAAGVNPNPYIEYKKSLLKQYFKENRALRPETIINDPKDFGVRLDLSNLPFLQKIGREVKRRLRDVQRVSHNCHLSQESVERVVQPTLTAEGQRAPGLRVGVPRTMALLAALTLFVHHTCGFRHGEFLSPGADLLGSPYSTHPLTYDLRRLRLKGLLWRIPKSHRDRITPDGCKVALFFTRLPGSVFRPGFAALDPDLPLPSPLAQAFAAVEKEVNILLEQAHVAPP